MQSLSTAHPTATATIEATAQAIAPSAGKAIILAGMADFLRHLSRMFIACVTSCFGWKTPLSALARDLAATVACLRTVLLRLNRNLFEPYPLSDLDGDYNPLYVDVSC